ncbi:MAG: hypothetical protein LBC86_01155 [Oscillospiraceae bacterium]|jgi:hypothetical protein|nr:hypothetical protein [Oscillospiraceae bacterium]
MEKHVLNEIYNVYRDGIKESEELTEIKDDLQAKLLKKLNNEQNVLFNKFINVCEEKEEYSSCESFKKGFCASIMLVIEAFN